MSTSAETPRVALPAGLEALLGPAGERRPSRSAAASPTTTCARATAAATSSCGSRARTPSLLGIDRECEREATAAAAAAGVGPEVVAYLSEPPDARHRVPPGPRDDAGRPRQAGHDRRGRGDAVGGPRHAARCATASRRGTSSTATRAPPRRAAAARRARSATCARARAGSRPRSTRRTRSTRRCRATTTCCPRTSSTTARRCGSSTGSTRAWATATSTSATCRSTTRFNEAGDEWLLECYWGEPCTRRRLATVRLMRIMSDLREAMWGVVQPAISELDFDFADYARGALRARAGRVRGPALRRLARGRPAWRVTCLAPPAA